MKRRIISCVLAFVMFVSAFAGMNYSSVIAYADETFTSGDYEYTVNNKNEIIIKSYLGNDSQIVIPSKIDGKPVVEIGDKAFYNSELLKSISLPESVTEIGGHAFNFCDALESVEMKGVEKLGTHAFYFCRNLSYVGYSEKLREIGAGAFSDCNLTGTLDLSSVTDIGAGAFGDTNVSKVILNDNLETLENSVFDGCALLEEINFPSKLVSIGKYCFRMSGINKAVFSEGLKSIGSMAFDMCKELYILELPESLEEIGTYAFQNTLLEIVTIPENLRVIGYGAFKNCKELDILHFNAKNCRVDFADQDYQDKTDDFGNAPPFIGCKLREIYFGDGVSSIGGFSTPFGTFENCSGLESIMIPDSVSVIGTASFKNCTSLETAVIPGSVTSIADDAFDGCDNLTILCFADSYVHSYAQENGIKVSTFVVAPIPNYTYTGKEITPEVSVSFSGDTLHKNIDFAVSYANNVNVGEADVTVKGRGDYKNFSNKVKFTIVTKSISSATVSAIPAQAYTGKAITPELIVTDGTKLLCENKDYTVSYSNNKREGTATVEVTGIGNYSGSLKGEFEIVKTDNGKGFFSNLIYRIEVFFAKTVAFFRNLFSFR